MFCTNFNLSRTSLGRMMKKKCKTNDFKMSCTLSFNFFDVRQTGFIHPSQVRDWTVTVEEEESKAIYMITTK